MYGARYATAWQNESMCSRPRKLRASLICVALILPTLTSCMTTAIWGGSIEEDEDGSSSLSFSGGRPLSDDVWVKILATPFAIVLDICTYPIQACMYGWDDEDDCD